MPTTATFDAALAFVLEREGGYSCDPRDPGGETRYGICKRAYPQLDIKALTPADAAALYQRDYWLAAGCDRMPPALAFLHFDAAVNQGVGAAAKLLQESLGVTADGRIGPATLEAARRARLPDALIEYAARRALRYGLAETFRAFGLGWMRRLMACLVLALDHLRG